MRRAFTLLATVTTLLWVGCGGPSGGGSTTINQHMAVYGIGKEGVSFVIFTDIPASNTQTRSAGKSSVFASQQAGSIMPASGTRIDYAGDSVSLKVGEQEYALAKGRVFLLTTGEGNLDVLQLDIRIEPTDLSSKAIRGEVQRLAENPKVSTFTAKPGEELGPQQFLNPPAEPGRHTRPSTEAEGTRSAGPDSGPEAQPMATTTPQATSDIDTRSEQEGDALSPLENPTAAPALAEAANAQRGLTATPEIPANREETEPAILTDYSTFTAIAGTIDEKTTYAYEMREGMALATPDGTWITGSEGELAVSPDGTMTGLVVTGDATMSREGDQLSGEEMHIKSNKVVITGSPRVIIAPTNSANNTSEHTP